MNARIDLFTNTYANFTESVLAAVREETFGEDIGQNSWVTADEYELFIAWLRLTPSSYVLEVASGSGGPALHLAQRSGCRVTGVDVNAHGVLNAERAAQKSGMGERAKFRLASTRSPMAASAALPFNAAQFDALMCVDSMNHFPDRLQSLQEWWRVLKPGTRAVFTDPVVITGTVTNDELAQRSSIGLFVFAPRGLNEELIVKAGWTLIEQVDMTDNAAIVSRRWRDARLRFRSELLQIEGEERYEGVQKFLHAVHRLTSERRLSRIAYVVEK